MLIRLLVERSRLQRGFTALRTNEAAAVMGVRPARYKLLAFVLSSLLVGLEEILKRTVRLPDRLRRGAGALGAAHAQGRGRGLPAGAAALRAGARVVLAVHNLSNRFGGLNAVQDLGFEVPAGEILAIIGPNGAGKTTTQNVKQSLKLAGKAYVLENGVVKKSGSGHTLLTDPEVQAAYLAL